MRSSFIILTVRFLFTFNNFQTMIMITVKKSIRLCIIRYSPQFTYTHNRYYQYTSKVRQASQKNSVIVSTTYYQFREILRHQRLNWVYIFDVIRYDVFTIIGYFWDLRTIRKVVEAHRDKRIKIKNGEQEGNNGLAGKIRFQRKRRASVCSLTIEKLGNCLTGKTTNPYGCV